MKDCMNKNVRNSLMVATLIVVTVLIALWAVSTFPPPWRLRQPPPYGNPSDWEFFYTAQTALSTINATLSIFLLLIYVSIYRKTRSEFTIGLIIFSAVLLLHTLTSIPLVHHVFGYVGLGLGPFAMLPDLFTCAALLVLLYLSIKY
jgi:hypothetical protein